MRRRALVRLAPLLVLLTACLPRSTGTDSAVPLGGRTAAPGTATWAPWPQASHDARRSGASQSVGPQSGGARWTRTLEGNVTPGPVIGAGNTVYAASNAGVLHALDALTGKDRWTYDAGSAYGSDLSTSPAVLPSGAVLWPGPRGLVALGPAGSVLWHLELDGSPTSPAIDGGRVVVGTTSGSVYGIDARIGKVLWQVDLGTTSYGSVALSPTDPHRSYQTAGFELVALDDNHVVWRRDLTELVEVSPAVAPDGTVVVGSNARRARAFSPAGRPLWDYDLQAQTYSSPVVTADGLTYVGDHKGVVTALDVRTGDVAARYLGPTERPTDNRSVGVWTSPVVDARHNVYWGSRSGHVVGMSASGKMLFDLNVDATVDSYPALGDGLLVVGLTDGRLMGIGA